jgi:hypothetical protein
MATPNALKHREGRAYENAGLEKAGMVDTPDPQPF